MTASPHTVFVVDDNPSVRRSLARLLRSAGHVVEVFASAAEFLQRERGDGVGCLVLDVQMPGMGGIELQAALERTPSCLPIVFITGHGDIPMSVRAMKAGAVDFLPKPFGADALLAAVDLSLARCRQEREARAEIADTRSRLATLTPREHEVLGLVVAGALNKQIAADLGAAEKTIKIHRGRVMQKMRVQSVAELVRVTEKAGVVAKR